MEKEIEELKLLLSNCFNSIDKVENLSDLYQIKIFLEDYVREYIKLNEKRIKSKMKILEGS